MSNYSNLTTEELLGRLADVENRIAKYDNLQRAKKEALNSAYGALG
jgi:hypothetical protein